MGAPSTQTLLANNIINMMIMKTTIIGLLIAAIACSATSYESIVPEPLGEEAGASAELNQVQTAVAPFPPSSSLSTVQVGRSVQEGHCRKVVSRIAKLMGSKMHLIKSSSRALSWICKLVCRSARTALKASRKSAKRLKGCRKKCRRGAKKTRGSIKKRIKKLAKLLCRKRKGRRSTRRKSSTSRRRRRRSSTRRRRRRSGRRRRRRRSGRRRRRRL